MKNDFLNSTAEMLKTKVNWYQVHVLDYFSKILSCLEQIVWSVECSFKSQNIGCGSEKITSSSPKLYTIYSF